VLYIWTVHGNDNAMKTKGAGQRVCERETQMSAFVAGKCSVDGDVYIDYTVIYKLNL
jgi:hypothetical protein